MMVSQKVNIERKSSLYVRNFLLIFFLYYVKVTENVYLKLCILKIKKNAIFLENF